MTPLVSLPLTQVSGSLSSQGDYFEELFPEPLQPSSMGPEQSYTLSWNPRTIQKSMYEGHLAFSTDVASFVDLLVQPVHEGLQPLMVTWTESNQKDLVSSRCYLLCVTRVGELAVDLADTLMWGLGVLEKGWL